ncbi:hypothetical protein pclt_cds_762 [Pandoravirus celtis]|uniref:Uncharacterized protein n=1 Tax=Pandoravirus celtis TaxID=2568002 RepID=A0A4D6EIL5_9VIRU|nr:hypothetical protein pclt_cds_762 [Pandoravirus celtis]
MYTGRHPADEARMWSSWWTACVDGLTTSWDALIDFAGPCPAPVDARFCKGGLALARLLLDLGAQRADQDVRADPVFKRTWALSRGEGPAPPRASAEYEVGIAEGDHERRHWAAMTRHDYLLHRVGARLDRWHLMRAMLVTAVALLERLYNTHAIYAALDIGALEHQLIERDVPRALYDTNTIDGGGDGDGSNGGHDA